MIPPIVICRRASDYLKPDYKTGYKCSVCGLELQVGPPGRDAIAAGAKAVCNPHGFALMAQLESEHADFELEMTPQALAHLEGIIETMRAKARAN